MWEMSNRHHSRRCLSPIRQTLKMAMSCLSHIACISREMMGPTFHLFGRNVTMSISKSGFRAWKRGNHVWNACIFASSFLLERLLLVVNDAVVAVTGRNFFFPNKPQLFHQDCTRYARVATLFRIALWKVAGWKSLLFLYLSETLVEYSSASGMCHVCHQSRQFHREQMANAYPPLPPMPENGIPYSPWEPITMSNIMIFPQFLSINLGNYKTLHRNFILLTKILHNIFTIMKRAFAYPDFYACMNAGIPIENGSNGEEGEVDEIATVAIT